MLQHAGFGAIPGGRVANCEPDHINLCIYRNFAYSYLHLLTGHNFSLNRKISLFWFCQEFPPAGCFSFFRRKLLHVFLWMRTIVGRKDTANGQKYPANGRKWPKSLLGRHCIKNQPRAEKNASGKKNTFGQLFCLKPFGLKLKPSRRSRYRCISGLYTHIRFITEYIVNCCKCWCAQVHWLPRKEWLHWHQCSVWANLEQVFERIQPKKLSRAIATQILQGMIREWEGWAITIKPRDFSIF